MLHVIYEDNHLLVVSKPAGLATMGVPEGKPSLLLVAKQYIKERYQKPGNVYLGIVSRLDAPVTGIIAIARTSKAASRLTEQYRSRQAKKKYWTVVERPMSPSQGQCLSWIRHDERHRRVQVAEDDLRGGKEARLRYRTLQRLRVGSLLEIELETGRKHQIRAQLAHQGAPVWGDRKYGGKRPFSPGIALHARSLQLMHPTTKEALHFEAPLPASWKAFDLGDMSYD